jgi:hypothetical protein
MSSRISTLRSVSVSTSLSRSVSLVSSIFRQINEGVRVFVFEWDGEALDACLWILRCCQLGEVRDVPIEEGGSVSGKWDLIRYFLSPLGALSAPLFESDHLNCCRKTMWLYISSAVKPFSNRNTRRSNSLKRRWLICLEITMPACSRPSR